MAQATSTLGTIRTKVRRLTQSISPAQLSDAELDQYINTFIAYDMATRLKLFSLRTTLTFYTQPGKDVYENNTTDPNDPLYNFNSKYTAVHQTAYVAGVAAFFTQNRDVFYGNWPQTNAVTNTGLFGNGTAGPFTGQLPPALNSPSTVFGQPHVLQGSVLFSCLDANGTAMNVVDYPATNTIGYLGVPGLDQQFTGARPNSVTNNGQVNYITGAYTVTFPGATGLQNPPTGNPVIATFINYAPGLPTSILYYNNKFTLRPVPDKAYVVQIEADIQPLQLLQTNDMPQIQQWWQYIAYGAAKKIFEDKLDQDSVAKITPEFEKQEALVLSTTMTQYCESRTVTPYTNNGINSAWGNGFNRWPY